MGGLSDRCQRNACSRLFDFGASLDQFFNVGLEDLRSRYDGGGITHGVSPFRLPLPCGDSISGLHGVRLTRRILCRCIRDSRVVSWQTPSRLNVARWQTRVAGMALGRHEARADGRAGRIVKYQGRGGYTVKVLPQPVKVILSQIKGCVNNVLCMLESSMISGI